jgi:DNA-binding CsgD family transcriptional regulator
MTAVAASVPVSSNRLRIAITSPDILAHIRQVFAAKNLAVEITRLPYIEVTVRPAARASAGRSAIGTTLHQPLDPVFQADATHPHRLSAEYRLSVIAVGDPLKIEHPRPAERRRHLTSVSGSNPDEPTGALSARQREVMTLVSCGVRNAEIAEQLQISEKTVKNHINRIFKSLGACNRVEAVLIWQQHYSDGAMRRGPYMTPTTLLKTRHPEP